MIIGPVDECPGYLTTGALIAGNPGHEARGFHSHCYACDTCDYRTTNTTIR